MIICDFLRGQFARFELRAHFLQAHGDRFNLFLLAGNGRFLLFILAMLLEELV